jgi:hypothetical protein
MLLLLVYYFFIILLFLLFYGNHIYYNSFIILSFIFLQSYTIHNLLYASTTLPFSLYNADLVPGHAEMWSGPCRECQNVMNAMSIDSAGKTLTSFSTYS